MLLYGERYTVETVHSITGVLDFEESNICDAMILNLEAQKDKIAFNG